MKVLKRVALVLPVLFLAFGLQSMTTVKGVNGTWSYSAPNAPYEYNSGEIIIAGSKGKQSVVVSIDNNKLEATDVKVSGSVVSFSVWVEGDSIPVKLTITGDKMEGVAQTPEGDLELKGSRKK